MKLLPLVNKLKRSSISDIISQKLDSFSAVSESGDAAVFQELCFCILTANYHAEGASRIQAAVGDGFLTLSKTQLAHRLKRLGHRFPNARAKYIVSARSFSPGLFQKLQSFKTQDEMRIYLADNIPGLGFKEASHFLRNIGFSDVAIIDFHIIDLLVKHRLAAKPDTLSRKRYLEIEAILRNLASKAGLSLGELDLYLWFLETGKILK